MNPSSLSSASIYLNNLLLARGLLQDGKSIDFTHPERDDNTMSRIINIVHDLVLRRDRDAEQRELLANNLRAMRVEESQRVLDMERVQDRNADLVRKMKEADAQERALKASLRKAETAAKEMKEQMLKMKSTLDQVRAKCLGDVRKRDLEIEKLKEHVAQMQRGQRGANTGPKLATSNKLESVSGRGAQDVSSAEWCLEKESNDFLAALVNETSGENVVLRNIVTEALETLREITGMEDPDQAKDETELDGIGIPGQYRKSRQRAAEKEQEAALMSCETLAKNISAAMDHCRSILKDPSFVPIEEVQVREVEINKLRDGWEKMASRWKEAVTMMETWRQNMLAGSPEKIDMNELSHLEFGKSIAVLPNGQPVRSREEIYSSILMDNSRIEMPQEEAEEDEEAERQKRTYDEFLAHSNVPRLFPEDDESFHPDDAEPSPKRLAISPKRGLRLPRPTDALRETDGNTRANASIAEEEAVPAMLSHSGDSGIGSLDGSAADGIDENDTFAGRNLIQSRIPRQPKSTLPALTVSEKLAAIEAEAREAEEERLRQQEAVTHKRKAPTKRKADKLRRSRRRSTLAPEELAELMGVR
jgi:Afadin- and alpha -actinin-Binding